MPTYTYKWVDPASRVMRTRIRFTRGEFAGWTPPTGLLKVPYAIFRNDASELLVPVYDLTKETLVAIGRPPTATSANGQEQGTCA